MRKTCLAFALLPLPAFGQTDDRSYLTALLEDNLSGAGRHVVITGFEGALSSQAHLDVLTIADDGGIWLTLRDVNLDWDRTALFSGNVSVNQLSAAEIILDRAPKSTASEPSAEASDFSLPELPVSIRIDRLAAEHITLGPSILGQAVEARMQAALSLVEGEGRADLTLERLDDGPEGQLSLTGNFSNADRKLALQLSATEGPGGLAATLLGLPGAPSVALEISGEGPFSDFGAKINLATDGVDRLVGDVAVKAITAQATGFSATLSGDLAPLFLPEYAAFFGSSVALKANGQRLDDGRIEVNTLDVRAKALALGGTLALAADGQPTAFDLTGRIAQADGSAVLLPLTTDLPVRVQNADIALAYDRAKGDEWAGQAQVSGFDRADFRASRLTLLASGQILPGAFGAKLRFDAEGLQPTDAALSMALGSVISGDAELSWASAGDGLAISKLVLQGQDYSAQLSDARINGLQVSGTLLAQIGNLSRLSGLAGQDLSGAAEVQIAGNGQPLTGAFDVELTARGTDMAAGIPQLYGLLRGQATLSASARRDTTGTDLRALTLQAGSLTAKAHGHLQSDASNLNLTANFADLSVLGKGYAGALAADAQFSGTLTQGSLAIEANGKGLRIGQSEADRLLSGQSKGTATLALKDGTLLIERAQISNPQLTASATGQLDGTTMGLDIDARLQNLALLLPEFPGALTVKGRVEQNAGGARIDLTGKGPGGIDATVVGSLGPDYTSGDLVIKGRAQAALANAFVDPRAISGEVGFNLRLKGPLAPNSLTGQITLQNGRLADPSQSFAFQDISARADLAKGQAKLAATLPVSTGGSVAIAGTIGLAEPFSAALGLGLERVVLRDPDLYETQINGDLTLTGPLAGGARIAGQLALGDTELRVPSTGFGGANGLPDLRHVGEPENVHATRGRAGLLGAGKGANGQGGAVYGLDVTISAPNRLFVRGRGLDAELGGELRLLGSTADVQPAGAFDLIRGRLDILGKRLDLDEALLQMEGELVPFLHILASTENDGITSSVLIDGPANDPKVSFTSSPELPEEEVLAQLLFGQGLQNLSALQALQLANAVASLAGKGGDGIVSRLRQGFGLDNLDVKTTAEGGTEITAGKYISKKVYSEVKVDETGKSEINLNFDVTDTITLRGRTSSDGSAGIGVYLEKDY